MTLILHKKMKELCFLIKWKGKKKELANIICMNILYITISVEVH